MACHVAFDQKYNFYYDWSRIISILVKILLKQKPLSFFSATCNVWLSRMISYRESVWLFWTVHFDTLGPSTLTLQDRPFWQFDSSKRTVHFESNDRLHRPMTVHFRATVHFRDRPLWTRLNICFQYMNFVSNLTTQQMIIKGKLSYSSMKRKSLRATVWLIRWIFFDFELLNKNFYLSRHQIEKWSSTGTRSFHFHV